MRTLDLARTGLLIQALGITLLDDVQRRIDKHLDKAQPRLFVELTGDGTVCAVWRDECGEADARCICEELRDLHTESV